MKLSFQCQKAVFLNNKADSLYNSATLSQGLNRTLSL